MSTPKNRVNIDNHQPLKPEISSIGREVGAISHSLPARKLQCVVKIVL
jgi:hypothetical protein